MTGQTDRLLPLTHRRAGVFPADVLHQRFQGLPVGGRPAGEVPAQRVAAVQMCRLNAGLGQRIARQRDEAVDMNAVLSDVASSTGRPDLRSGR